MAIKFDASSFFNRAKQISTKINQTAHNAVNAVADETLRLSQFQVPHDTGLLQNSGHVEPGRSELEAVVGYNKVYAARLHEHPEYHFQKGRKGKYLEDPIKSNIDIFRNYIIKAVQEALT